MCVVPPAAPGAHTPRVVVLMAVVLGRSVLEEMGAEKAPWGLRVRACWGKKVLCALSKQRFPYLRCGVCVYIAVGAFLAQGCCSSWQQGC